MHLISTLTFALAATTLAAPTVQHKPKSLDGIKFRWGSDNHGDCSTKYKAHKTLKEGGCWNRNRVHLASMHYEASPEAVKKGCRVMFFGATNCGDAIKDFFVQDTSNGKICQTVPMGFDGFASIGFTCAEPVNPPPHVDSDGHEVKPKEEDENEEDDDDGEDDGDEEDEGEDQDEQDDGGDD